MLRYIVTCLLLSFASFSQASVILGTTRVIFNSSEKEATVQIRNPDNLPKLIQAWIDDGNKDQSPDLIEIPFQILPPVFRINENKGQALRILALPNDLPTDRESVFWLNVLEVAPKPDNAEVENYVQFALRSRIKLFYRPKGLQGQASLAGEKLEWRINGENLVVKNPTPYHVSLSTAKAPESSTKNPTYIQVDMVLPFSEQTIYLEELNLFAGSKIEFTYIDDLGATRTSSATILN